MIVYIVDILVHSSNLESHIKLVQEVLLRLKNNHLLVKAEKCKFHVSSTTFLAYMIGPEKACMAMDTSKVDAVKNWPLPNTIKVLQRFLGLANFYRQLI